MNTAFLHIATIGNEYNNIANEMVNLIYKSKLLENLTKLYILVLGKGRLNLDVKSKRIDIIYYSDDVTLYEYPTIQLIEDYALVNTSNILYLTGLGVTGRTLDRENRRKYITYFVIERWKDCIKSLEDGYDTCGVDWRPDPLPHYSGFMWWAKSQYLRTLPKVKKLNTEKYPPIFTDRHQAEFWIGYGNPKWKSLHQSMKTDTNGKHTWFFHTQEWNEGWYKHAHSDGITGRTIWMDV